jgi:predicted dehydrogenase
MVPGFQPHDPQNEQPQDQPMSERLCRWGIMSTAGIARKNWQAIRNTDNATIVAVASRDAAKAKAFVDECQTQIPFDAKPDALGSYEALLSREDVDAVYIPLPTGVRKEWVIKAAQAGKHVMCEKPCADTLADLVEMTDVCRENNVQFMDGVMFMHSERMAAMRAVLDDGESVGRIRRIQAQFSFCAPDEFLTGNIRVNSALESLGCLGDLGWYTVRMTLWALNYELPVKVTGRLLATRQNDDSPEAVPMEFSGELIFANGVSAGFYNSFQTENMQLVNISGSKGYLTLDDFVLPFYGNRVSFETNSSSFSTDCCDFHMEEHTRHYAVREYSDSKPEAQETNLFHNFSALALSGTVDDTWPSIALKTQQVLNACLESARNGGKEVSL